MRKIVGRGVASGFTIIEVMLVLSITGFLFVGLTAGMSSNLARQRYKDAVQDSASVLRTMYSYVTETQVYTRNNDTACFGLTSDYINDPTLSLKGINTGRGRSNCVVYGVAATIVTKPDWNRSHIEITTMIGMEYERVRTKMLQEGINLDAVSEMEVLQRSDVNNMVATGNTLGDCSRIELVDLLNSYNTKWGTKYLNLDGTPMNKTILIFRSPRNGAIRTYVYDDVLKDHVGEYISYEQFILDDAAHPYTCADKAVFDRYGVNKAIREGKFTEKSVDICVSNGAAGVYNGAMRMINIAKGARNASGVSLIDMDDGVNNKCN